MPMTAEQILEAIQDRMRQRWPRRLVEENAAPVCTIAIKQLAGPEFGKPVVCTTEDMPEEMLAGLLIGIARQLAPNLLIEAVKDTLDKTFPGVQGDAMKEALKRRLHWQ